MILQTSKRSLIKLVSMVTTTFNMFLLKRITIFLVLVLISFAVKGVELKKKLSGSATMTTADTDITVNLPSSVDLSQSFLLYSVRVSDPDVEEVLIGGELASATTLEFHRDASGSEVNIEWQVLEFLSGISVQRGTYNNLSGAQSITISSVNTSQSFATVSLNNNGNTYSTDDGVTIDINSATSIIIEANQNNITATYWQVIECADCNVQKINTTLSNGSTSLPETITSVNTSKTLLFTSQRIGGNINGEDLPRATLTNSTTVTYTRSGNSNDIDLITYVVEFSDATTVQHGSLTFAPTELTNAATITSVDANISMVYSPGPLGYQGSSTNNGDDNPGSNWFTASFASGTSIDFTRSLDTYSGEITYQVAEFFYTPPTTWYTYGGGGNWSDPATWTLNGSGLDYDNPSSLIPGVNDLVVIMGSNGAAVTMDIDNVTIAGLDNSGELYVGTTSGHDFTSISGNGTIYLSGSGGLDNFPDGGIALFADTIVGGTVEYNGTGLTMDQSRTFNNFILNLDNNTDNLVLLNDLTVNGDFTLTQGDFQINDNSSTTILNLSVGKSALVDANASISVGQGDTRNPYTTGSPPAGTGTYHDIFHQVTFYSDFTNQGSVRFTNQTAPVYNAFTTTGGATVIFTGDKNSSVSLFGTTDFYNLILDKGSDQTFILEINSDNVNNFALYGPNNLASRTGGVYTSANPEIRKALWIYHGTLKFTGYINIPSLTEGGEDYIIGGNGALMMDGTNVQIYSTATDASEVPGGSASGINTGSGNQAMTLQGKFQINSGNFGTRNSAGFIFRDISSGEVIVNGGNINVSQFRSSSTGAGSGKLSYTQSGGSVLVRNDISEAGELNQNYALFSFSTTETVFTMSGGTLTTYGRTDGGTIFLNSDPGNYNITGGNVNVEIGDAEEPVISSRVPFWNLTLDINGGSATTINVDSETSGGETILDPDLIVLNNLTIKSGVTLDHEGNDVEVGSDFTVENGAIYLYDVAKPNTLTMNGIDNAIMGLYNIDGGGDPADQQVFYNLIIDKPHGKTITLESSKTGGNLLSWQNNLFRVNGDAFKVLSGTLDQGVHSILANCDTVVNYDVLTVFDPVDAGTDANPNSENDQLKFASNQGTPTDIVLITSDTAVIGNLKYYMQTNIVNLQSDLSIQYLEYSNGRLNIQDHNLKVDYWDETKDFNGGSPSVNHMIVTDGNVSDGGLSLYIDSERSYTYFFGIGLTGSEPASKYTPATVTVSNFTDDGYITLHPVDQQLATTDPTGGDILSYYWKVSYSDFTSGSEPTVTYQFTYYDDDLDGSTNEGLFVPGKVLEIDPFTRSSEVNGNMNTTTNVITFNGDTGSGSSPFTLEEASYTAGEPGRFVGAPTVFYSNVETGQWAQSSTWALDRDGTIPAGTYPAGGDIAIIQRIDNSTSPDNGTITIRSVVQAARVIFDDRHGFVNGTPKIVFDAQPNYDSYGSDFKSVEVAGTHEGGPIPSLSQGAVIQFNVNGSYAGEFPNGDFVDFNNYPNAQVVYAFDGANGDITLSADATEYPNLEISSVNSSGTIRFPDTTVVINGNFDVIEMEVVAAGGAGNYLTIEGDFNIGTASAEGEFYFPGGSEASSVVEVKGDLTLDGDNNKTNLGIENPNSGAQIHRLIVHGDITIGAAGGNIDFGDGNLARTNVELELTGEGINESNNLYGTGLTIDLYRVIMDKGSGINNTFTFNHDFALTGSTNTTTKAIELQNGLLALNNASLDLDLSTGGGDFSIPGTAGLQVTQGTVNVSGDDIGILLNGSLIIDGGTVNMDDAVGNGNNYIEYGAAGNATIEISAGSLTVGSQIRTNVAVPSGILTYTQTGGDAVVGKNAAPEATTGVFEVVNTGSSFTYTGGTLTLVRQNTATPGVAALRILPTFSNVTETIYVGNTDTPISQDNFGIYSSIPLAGLTISGTNNPTAVIMVNDLTLKDQLTIESGGTLDGNGIDLTLGADFVNDGTYTPNGNATIFDSESIQNISGIGTTGFYDFYKQGNGTLNSAISFQVDNNFYLSLGTFDDNSNSIDLKGNMEIDGTHQSTGGAGDGLRLSGTASQQLTRSEAGNSSLGIFTLQNSSGIVIPEGGGYNFTINDELKMNGGIFNIGSSEVTIGSGADITTTGSFSVTNMVQTNSTFNDNGLVKIFPAGFTGTFLYPMGEANYTPITVDCSVAGGTSGTTVGSIAVRPANEYHPTIDDGTDNVGGGAADIDNVLQYYWTLRANNMTGFSGDIIFQYDQNDISLTDPPGYTEADYIPARILAFNNPTYLVNKYSASDVDETANEILFTAATVFAGVDENGISGDYFCGIDDAIPNNIATYTVILDGGSVSDGLNTYTPIVTGGGAPSGAVVIIPAGFELIFDNNSIELYKTEIQSGATLTIDNTKFHRLGILEGTGTLKIVHDAAGNPTLPLADYGTFFSCSGGSIEYAGSGSYTMSFQGQPAIRNLTLSGSGSRTFPNMDMTICEDLIINGPDIDGFIDRSLTVSNNMSVLSGNFYAFSGSSASVSISNDLSVNGGNYLGSTSGETQIIGDLNLISGSFSVGTSNYKVGLWTDFNFSGGSFDAGNTNTLFTLWTNPSRDQNSVLNGDFTGADAFYNLRIYKASTGRTVELNGNLEIDNQLNLVEGIINTNSNTLSIGATTTVTPDGGQESSYINGRVTKTLSTVGDDFIFPIGGATRYRPAYVQDVTTGGLDWEAEYFDSNPTTDPDVANLTSSDPAILTMSTEEYWRITDGQSPGSASATVGLSWGSDSYVSSVSAEREQLRVMVWNSTNSNWDNAGGANYSGGHTQDFGMFNTSSAVSFSEKIFTLGSTDLSNPLPVELVSFTGKEAEGRVLLSWETASELNNDYFVIEHSLDGRTFSEIGIVEGAGTTHASQFYSFTHRNPGYPDNYYRLKQIDFDGAYEYSDVILVRLESLNEADNIDFIIYPNPTSTNSVTLALKSIDFSKSMTLEVVTLNGRLISSELYELGDLRTEYELDLGYAAPKGIYLVRLIQPGSSIVKKLVLK